MAPPAPSSAPLQQRLLALAQTLQFAWFVGHVTLLFCALRYALSYMRFNFYSTWARFSYRTAFLAAAVTYGIVVYKGFKARMRQGKNTSPVTMLTDENVQYLAMALVWLFSKQIPLAILPFAVYSVFHVATYVRSNVLPTLQPAPPAAAGASPGQKPKPSALSDAIGRFVKEHYDSSMTLVAILEISLWFRLLGSAVLFQKGSLLLILIYTVFFRARYSQSSFVQGAINQLVVRVDAQAANQSTPPAVRNGWDAVKRVVRQAADLTDLNRYLGGAGAGAPQKKAQ